MRKARSHATGKTLPAADALDRRTHDRHVARGEIEHALDGEGGPGRALAFHPAAQALQHGLGIKRKIGRVHFAFSRTSRIRVASFALRRYENDPRRICKVKHAARRAGLAQPKTGLTRHALGASLN